MEKHTNITAIVTTLFSFFTTGDFYPDSTLFTNGFKKETII